MGQKSTKTEPKCIDLPKIYENEFQMRLISDNTLFEQKRALDLAHRRESLSWEILAVGTTTITLLVAGSIYKRKDLIVPIVPLIMGMGYRYDIARGDNLEVVKDEAEKILKTNKFVYPGGPITLKEIDEFRTKQFLS